MMFIVAFNVCEYRSQVLIVITRCMVWCLVSMIMMACCCWQHHSCSTFTSGHLTTSQQSATTWNTVPTIFSPPTRADCLYTCPCSFTGTRHGRVAVSINTFLYRHVSQSLLSFESDNISLQQWHLLLFVNMMRNPCQELISTEKLWNLC